MEELLEGPLLNGANFLGKCLGVVWDLIRKHNQKLPRKVKKKIRETLLMFELLSF